MEKLEKKINGFLAEDNNKDPYSERRHIKDIKYNIKQLHKKGGIIDNVYTAMIIFQIWESSIKDEPVITID